MHAISAALQRSVLLASYDFTGYTPGAVTMPSGLVLTRASTTSVQTSASTIVLGIAVDVARVGYSARGNGLRIEESRTNLLMNSRAITGAGWGTGTGSTSLDFVAGPDGTVSADRSTLASGQFSNYRNIGSAGLRTFSVWGRHATGSGTWVPAFEAPVTANSVALVLTGVDTTWRRVAMTCATGQFAICCDGRSLYSGTTAGARDVVTDCHQAEDGSFSTSYIPTTTVQVTRAGERLTASTPSALVAGGRLSLYAALVPYGARGEYGAAMRLWTIDASNYAQLSPTDGKVTVVVGGASYTTASGATWAAGDLVEVWLEAGGGSLVSRVVYRVNGGSATVLGTSGAAQAAISAPSTLDLMCSGTGSQLTSTIQKLAFYNPGRYDAVNAWAA